MSSPDHFKAGSSHEPKVYSKIRTKISEAEQQAVAALEELRLRLSAPYLKAQIQGSLRLHVRTLNEKWMEIYHHGKYSMVKTIDRHPLPAALIGLGLIFFQKVSANGKKKHPERKEYGIPVRQETVSTNKPFVEHQVRKTLQTEQLYQQPEYVTWETEQAGRQIRQWKEESEPKKEGLATYLHKQVMFARGAFIQGVHHHPLAMGAVMLTMGAVLAAALPRSRKEDQWMGEKRDKCVEAVKLQLHSTLEEVKQETGKAVKKLFDQENHVRLTNQPTPKTERKIR